MNLRRMWPSVNQRQGHQDFEQAPDTLAGDAFCFVNPFVEPELHHGMLFRAARVIHQDISHSLLPAHEIGALAVDVQRGWSTEEHQAFNSREGDEGEEEKLDHAHRNSAFATSTSTTPKARQSTHHARVSRVRAVSI